MPLSTLEVLQTKEHTLIPYFYLFFTFRFTFESFTEFGMRHMV
jgi:hypothetical protein